MFRFLGSIRYAKGSNYLLILNIIFAIIGNILILFAPLYVGFSVDYMIGVGSVDVRLVILNLVFAAGFYVFGSLISYFGILFANIYAAKLTQIVKQRAFHNVMMQPINKFEKLASGDILVKLTLDATQLQDAITFFFTHFSTGISTLIFTTIALFILSYPFAIVIVASAIPIYLYTRSINRRSGSNFQKIQALTAKMTSYAQEMIDEHDVVVSYNYQDKAAKHFNSINDELCAVAQKGYFFASMNNPTFRLIANITYALLGLVFILTLPSNVAIHAGVFMTILMYANLFAKPVGDLSSVSQQFFLGSASFERLRNNLYEPEAKSQGLSIKAIKSTDIEFSDVSYLVADDVPVVKHLSFKVYDGQKVAIVGPSGAGKSTIIGLLLGFYRNYSGKISINNIDVNKINDCDYSKLFGVVTQDSWIFKGSIAQNISFGKPNATQEEIINCAIIAGCHEFIMRLPQQYETIIDANFKISAGQKQAISIARALLVDPRIYVWDEPSANLDGVIEQKISHILSETTKGKTTFVVAHRLRLIKDFDLILVIENGLLAEQGTHNELLMKKGLYATLYEKQT